MTDSEFRRIRLLDRLYDFRPETPGQMASTAVLLDGVAVDYHEQSVWRGILRDLEADGFIMLAESMGFDGTSAMLKAPGRADVEARRKRRADRAARNSAARDAVINRIYAHPRQPITPMREGPSYFFEGQPFESAELTEALDYLYQKGLVTGLRGDDTLIAASVTPAGQECVEQFGGSVSDHARRGEGSGTVNNVTFNGAMSGNVAWENQTVTQGTTATSIASDELANLVAAILQAVPSLGLPEADAATLASNLKTIEGELAGGEPDKGVVATFAQRVAKTLGKHADNSLALVLGASTTLLMQHLGLPTQ